MTGGLANLRTAAIALGLALVVIGAFSLIQATTSHSTGNQRDPALRFASAYRAGSTDAAPVSLGPLEIVDPPPKTRTARKLSTSPAQLLAQIDSDDVPPPPAKPTDGDDPVPDSKGEIPPQRSPAAELMDLEPIPATPSRTGSIAQAAPECCERQEQQLARIALGLELLARQTTQGIIERTASDAVPRRTETFVAPASREATALIKIERTADDRDRFSLEVHAAAIGDVFGVLCDMAGLKLELAPEVTERVTLTLREVTLGEAINAVLRQANLGVERDEHVMRVMPRMMAEDRALRQQPLVTKIYRPQMVGMAAVLPLIRPLMTPRIGRLAVMPDPAGRLCPDAGHPFPGLPSEILVIVDRAEVHTEIAKLLHELDALTPSP